MEAGSDPAAGSDWSVTVPGGEVWDLLSVYASLVTGAAAGSRGPRLQLGDGVSTFLDIAPVGTQGPSLTGRWAWITGSGPWVTGQGYVGAIPHISLLPGWTVGVITTGLDALDDWSTPRLYVCRTQIRGGPIDLDAIPDLLVGMVGGAPG